MAKIVADANVLLRLITRAPEPMFEATKDFLMRTEEKGARVSVHPLHVAESVYVLEGEIYGLSPAEAAGELLTLLQARVFAPIEETVLRRALTFYPDSGLDFPDAFLLAWAEENGAQVVSFDRKLARLGRNVLVPESNSQGKS
ncbi:PIN domain-containing protein [Oceanithermus sp.]